MALESTSSKFESQPHLFLVTWPQVHLLTSWGQHGGGGGCGEVTCPSGARLSARPLVGTMQTWGKDGLFGKTELLEPGNVGATPG